MLPEFCQVSQSPQDVTLERFSTQHRCKQFSVTLLYKRNQSCKCSLQIFYNPLPPPPPPPPPVTSNDSCLNKFKKVGSCMNTSYFYVLQQSKSVYKKLTALFNQAKYTSFEILNFCCITINTQIDNLSEIAAIFIQ